MSSVSEKVCTKCGVSKPETLEFFYKQTAGKNGLNAWCKICFSANRKARYQENKEKELAQCKIYSAVNADKKRLRAQLYYQENREEFAVRSKTWREANQQRANELNKAWREKNPEKYAELQRAWRKENPERVRETDRKCRAKNPLVYRAKYARRRALKKAAFGTHAAADIDRQFAAQKGRCWWCGTKLVESGIGKFHVDHREPLSKGGSNGPENLVCTCPKCNLTKHDKTPLEFAGRLF